MQKFNQKSKESFVLALAAGSMYPWGHNRSPKRVMDGPTPPPPKKDWLTMDLRAGEHPDEHTLEKYLLGSLDQHAAKQIEEHLLLCQECIENARNLEGFIQAMRKALQTEPKKAKAAKKGKT